MSTLGERGMGFLFLFQEFPLQAFGEGGGREKQLESFAKMTQSCLAIVQELTKHFVCLSLLESLRIYACYTHTRAS